MTLVLLFEQREEDLDAVDRPPQVDAQDPLPVVDRGPRDWRKHADSGVVAQHVHGAEGVDRRPRQRLDAGQLGDVGGHTDDVMPLRAQAGDRFAQRFGAHVGRDHAHASSGKRPDHAEAHTGGGAGHHGHPTFDGLHLASSLLLPGVL